MRIRPPRGNTQEIILAHTASPIAAIRFLIEASTTSTPFPYSQVLARISETFDFSVQITTTPHRGKVDACFRPLTYGLARYQAVVLASMLTVGSPQKLRYATSRW